jgi:hypothetical protein
MKELSTSENDLRGAAGGGGGGGSDLATGSITILFSVAVNEAVTTGSGLTIGLGGIGAGLCVSLSRSARI